MTVYLQPVAAVKKGYGWLHTRVPLTHGDQFWMSGLNFLSISATPGSRVNHVKKGETHGN